MAIDGNVTSVCEGGYSVLSNRKVRRVLCTLYDYNQKFQIYHDDVTYSINILKVA